MRILFLNFNLSKILFLRNILPLRLSRRLSRATLLGRLRGLFLLWLVFLGSGLCFLFLALFDFGTVLGLLLLGGWGAYEYFVSNRGKTRR